MGYSTFKGGIHPFDGKALSEEKPIVTLLPKGDMVYPLSQHIGAPAKAIVKKGDYVKVGQILGEASAFVSANVISSVSGTVKAMESRLLASGSYSDCVIVENDQEYVLAEGIGEKRDLEAMSKEEIREAIKNAGIVGMGGAGFPTHIKMSPKNEEEIDYIIINGVECEPYLTSDYRVMLEESDQLIGGVKVIKKLFKNAKAVIAIEENKPLAIQKLSKCVENEAGIEVQTLKMKYPQGAERNLVEAVTGRKLNSKKLPADMGCVVSNIDTVVAIYKAVCEGMPIMRRIVTVTGDAIANPCNISVKTGTNYRELVEYAGGFTCEPEKIVSGGPMMGFALTSLDVPVTKSSSALLCLSKDEVSQGEETACIRCGHCIEVCPSHLVPQKMREACEHFDLETFEKLHGMECYECGCCTYNCPAKLPLTQIFKQSRKAVMAARRNKK